MAWQDRLKEGAYTSQQGDRLTFQFTDVSKGTPHKGAVFEFPDVDGAYVQRRGLGGRSFPMKIFFSGDDHDLEADAFEFLLETPGIGVLEHPRYGVLNVTPLGTVTRNDQLVSGSNQVVLDVEFIETILQLYPEATEEGPQTIANALSVFNDAMAEAMEDRIVVDNASERFSFFSSYQNLLDQADTFLQPVAELKDEVASQYYAIRDSINSGLDTLIDDPLTLAYQTLLLIQAPAQTVGNVQAQLSAYANLASSIFAGDGAVRSPGNGNENTNDYRTAALFATGAVAALASAAVNADFKTKPDAVGAAQDLLLNYDGVRDWRDLNNDSLGVFTDSGAYSTLLNIISGAAGQLVTISFSLQQERRIYLTEARTSLDLIAELYGNIDDETHLFFINSNNLSGSERLEIPKGRPIVYYV